MAELNKQISNDESEDDHSDNNLEIVLESPRRSKASTLNESDKKVIQSVEDEIEKDLDAKAAKTKLNSNHVKNIIKHVVSNEHVLALIRKTEDPENFKDCLVYEPKLTRAKTKELLSTAIMPPASWVTKPESESEVNVLIGGELQEDSSGDEYVPGDESEEDESFLISESDPASVPPELPNSPPPKINDSSTQTDEPIFKVPKAQTEEEKANIFLRTRSKVSLTSTPLEHLEESFIPPDITMDMYDLECDDEDWKDFLKKFTRPLDEITKLPEDDENHDPEYNILADEQIDEVDREELRMDRAVKVSRKELNDLMAELFEFADIYDKENRKDNNCSQTFEEVLQRKDEPAVVPEGQVMIDGCQLPVLQQQLRQHIQLLLQNFLLCYQHPELHQQAVTAKEYLLNFKFLCEGKQASMFYTSNLQGTLDFIDYWENLFASNTSAVQLAQMHVNSTNAESTKGAKNLTFSRLLLQTISQSEVFLYPSLLPHIPFKSLNCATLAEKSKKIDPVEDNLIAMAMEQFYPIASQDKRNLTNKGEVRLKVIAGMIQEHLMPHYTLKKIYHHISLCRRSESENPIKYYFENKAAANVNHEILPFDLNLPPCKMPVESLPNPWRQFNYPQHEIILLTPGDLYSPNVLIQQKISATNKPILPKPVSVNSSISSWKRTKRLTNKRKKLESQSANPTITKQATPLDNLVKCLNNVVPVESVIELLNLKTTDESPNMSQTLPSMPNLATPIKRRLEELEAECDNNETEIVSSTPEGLVDFENECSTGKDETEKDNLDDINALLIASSTVKPSSKESAFAEKKRAKVCREFASNILIATPESPDAIKEKNERFAFSYYDKLRERLDLEEYHKVMQILNDYEDKDGVQLYKQLDEIFRPKYNDLADEFLLFLKDKEAIRLGQFIPWVRMQTRSMFLRNLETYFKDQPAQLRKIYKLLTELTQSVDCSMEKIKSALLPLLKSSNILTDLFMQNFLSEPPPPSLLEGAYETLDINKELTRTEIEEPVETITVPNIEDKFGGLNCACSCHKIEEPEFKSRYRHCIPCGTKFMQGRVYIQTGRGLKPATVSFPSSPNEDHNIRLNGKSSMANIAARKKRSDSSPSKQVISPSKDNDEDSDEMEGKKRTRIKKSMRKKKSQPDKGKKSDCKGSSCDNSFAGESIIVTKSPSNKKKTSISKRVRRKSDKKIDVDGEESDTKPGSSLGQEKRLANNQDPELVEWDNATSLESIELKNSPDQNTADSESEICDESSQDNCDSDNSNSSYSQSDNIDDGTWKRDEDKIILETFRTENDKENAFKLIANQLTDRSIPQIRTRFQRLMSLLLEQIGGN